LLLALFLHAVCQLGNKEGLCLELLDLFDFFVGDAVCNAMPDTFCCGLVLLVMLSKFFLHENPEVHKMSHLLWVLFPIHEEQVQILRMLGKSREQRQVAIFFFACPTFNN
jgi:hypothetical protein